MPQLRLPRIVGHRGVTETAPENTLAAIRQAAAEGASWIEFDVQLDGDGHPRVIHDGDLLRVGRDPRPLGQLTAAELGRIDVGTHYDPLFSAERVPLLADVLALACALRLGVNIELKNDSASAADCARASWPVIARYRDRLAILCSAFDFSALQTLRGLDRDLALGALFEALPADWRQQVADFNPTSLHLWHQPLQDSDIAACAEAGLQLMVYSVDNTGLARRLWRRGVRVFCSGTPAAVAAALEAERP